MLNVQNVAIERNEWQCHFNFTVEPGELLLISGASGAGKSTLLDIIAGFTEPSSGQLLWQNQPFHQHVPAKRPVSMLFQQNNVFEHLSVQQNLALGMTGARKITGAQQQQVEQMAERLQINSLLNRGCTQLSGGQLQRVALGRALLMQRPLLLLDEPFSALDRDTRQIMQQLVHDVHREFGLTTLVVSHQPEEMQAIASRQLQVEAGGAHFI